ncbi:MAG TPA: hypothetical protein VEG60_00025 [Candidatus Binatia bacterium]|nr:hypothetical protein [Candidatus Binatia bacterium]
MSPLPLRQVGEQASVDLQPLKLGCHVTPELRHEAVSHLGGIKKLLALVIADYQRVKRIPRSVAPDDKLLPPVDLVLDPCAASLAGFVDGILAFGDDALEAKLFSDPDQFFRACVEGLCRAIGAAFPFIASASTAVLGLRADE